MVDLQAVALTYMMDGRKICQALFLYYWPGAQALSASLKIGSKVQSEGRGEEELSRTGENLQLHWLACNSGQLILFQIGSFVAFLA